LVSDATQDAQGHKGTALYETFTGGHVGQLYSFDFNFHDESPWKGTTKSGNGAARDRVPLGYRQSRTVRDRTTYAEMKRSGLPLRELDRPGRSDQSNTQNILKDWRDSSPVGIANGCPKAEGVKRLLLLVRKSESEVGRVFWEKGEGEVRD